MQYPLNTFSASGKQSTTLGYCFFFSWLYSSSIFFNLPSILKQELNTFISDYFITFYTCHYTVLLSPGVDILSNLNYFPVPRVGNLTKKLPKNSNAAPLPVPRASSPSKHWYVHYIRIRTRTTRVNFRVEKSFIEFLNLQVGLYACNLHV